MYSIFNPKKTILVDYQDKNFVVEDLLSRKCQSLPERQFYGPSFKYRGDFFRKFLNCFSEKTEIIFTDEGHSHYMSLKTANREGIFEE